MADIFIQISGIPGDSLNASYPGWIEAISFSWGVDQPALGFVGRVASATGRPDPGDFVFVAPTSSASPRLFVACAQGLTITEVNLEITRAAEGKPIPYLQWKLSGVSIKGYQSSAGHQNPLRLPDGTNLGSNPVDVVRLAPSVVQMTYTPVTATGAPGTKITAGYDFTQNQAR